MTKPKIGIVIGSTREARFADKPAEWIASIAKARGDLDVEIVDLRDFPMPFFDEEKSPAWAPSRNEAAQAWQKKVADLDGFIITAAEPGQSHLRPRECRGGSSPRAASASRSRPRSRRTSPSGPRRGG